MRSIECEVIVWILSLLSPIEIICIKWTIRITIFMFCLYDYKLIEWNSTSYYIFFVRFYYWINIFNVFRNAKMKKKKFLLFKYVLRINLPFPLMLSDLSKQSSTNKDYSSIDRHLNIFVYFVQNCSRTHLRMKFLLEFELKTIFVQ